MRRFWVAGLACGAVMVPSAAFAQANLVIDNNTTLTDLPGAVTHGFTVVGDTSGTVGGVPGGTYIVPIGSDVTLTTAVALADLTVARGANSSGLVDVGGTILLANIVVANGVGSVGTLDVNGGAITTTYSQSQYYIGAFGQGTMAVSNGGAVTSLSQTYLGYRPGSSGVLTVEGPESTYSNGGFFVVGNEGQGQLNILDGGVVATSLDGVNSMVVGGDSTGSVLVSGAGSQLSGGAFLTVGVNPASVGVLTITDEGAVDVTKGLYIAYSAGSTGTFNVGAAAGDLAAVPGTLTTPSVTFGDGAGHIVFNPTDTSGSYVFAPPITGGGATNSFVDVYSGVTVMTGASDYFGVTTIHAGPAVTPLADEGVNVTSTLKAGAPNVFSPNSDYIVQAGGTLDLVGHDQTVLSLTNAGLVRMAVPGGTPGTVLTTGNYIGQGGTIIMDTFLGTDGSPSDVLVIDGGTATGTTLLHILNIGGPGALTVARGIQVVREINGATITPGSFALDLPEFAGGFGYTLVQEDDGNWYLRSTARGERTCTEDRTYWQTHSSQGPGPFDPAWSPYENEQFFLSGQTFFDVISTNSGNPYDMLATQYMTALLNSFAGTDLTTVEPSLMQAAALFVQYTPAEIDALPLDSPVRNDFMQAMQTLALYNEGALGPVSCQSNCCCDAGQCDAGCDAGTDSGTDGGSDGGTTMGDPGTGSNGSSGAGGGGFSDSGGCSASSAASHGAAFPLGLGSMLALFLAARARRSRHAERA
ncbi:MAG: hypothetical protein FWD69_14625 [Polyangiaceae bacterium]|nr:hypothetical protein [Polyangiaceae bacterium]